MSRAHLEILESRIAPAVFFVSGTDLTIKDGTGAVAAHDAGAEASSGAHTAVLLHKGDSLIFDANGNHKADGADYTMFSVKAGQAEVFFTDTNTDGKYEPVDFTGVAFGDGFKGALTGDLNGDFAALLTAAGTFDKTNIQPSSLAGLTFTGHIFGDVVAGRNITGIVAKPPKGSDPLAFDIDGRIDTGNAFNGDDLSFDGGLSSLVPTYTPAADEAGGNISKVTLPGGTRGIFAGNGGNGTTKGGSISGITLGAGSFVQLYAGAGGSVATGAGGAGGDIVNVKVATHTTLQSVGISAGAGGNSSNGAGGAGGKLSGLVITTLEQSNTTASISGGQGGIGGGTGAGGVGGVIENSKFTFAKQGGDINIAGGAGGNGGNGVAVGGKGGDVMGVSVVSHGETYNSFIELYVVGGQGGLAGTGSGSAGGAGGNLLGLKVTTDGEIGSSVTIDGGRGGNGGSGVANGGKGGDIANIKGTFGNATTGGGSGVEFDGGNGGSGGNAGGNGGGGGNVGMLTATNLGYVDSLYAYAGQGGDASGASGNGGQAGNTSNVVFTNKGGARAVGIYSENGGDVDTTVGNGGNAGNLSNATIRNMAFVGTGDIFLGGYYGGTVNAGTGNGGRGGNATNLKVLDAFGTTASIYIYAGSGGPGRGAGGKGGDAGTLSKVFINAPLAHCDIGYNFFSVGDGGTGAAATGGDGGLITNVSGTVHELRVQAYPGGNATAGTGGNGGEINGVKFTVTHFANIIMAGNGGNSTSGTAGTGGSVKNVAIAGDIGDFDGNFDTNISYADEGMGGLVAGAGGKLNGILDVARNGSITNVSATRIAAILAGFADDNSLFAGNAVAAISKLKAKVIGADLNQNGTWDYDENVPTGTGFQLQGTGPDTDDTLIDGLVLVKTGGFASPPVVPLQTIEV